ncbi:hypothetical protein GCM10022410_03140 [Amphibacillus indicireducens]|uniref:Uncharacterized protein n=1 Tax=Amphibacillus indicireducens TaxID=1076330 RepID=A0ABP7V4C1_9BACI
MNSNDINSAREIAREIWNDLSERDTWYFDDILLVNNILFMFEGETINAMYDRAIHSLGRYKGFQNNVRNNMLFSLKFNKLSYDMFYPRLFIAQS